LPRATAQQHGVSDGGRQFRMRGRHRGAGARDAFEVGGQRGDLADAGPCGHFAGVAPWGGRRDRRIARQARGELREPTGRGLRIGREDDDIRIAAGVEHFVEMRDVADHALPARVVGFHRRPREPGLDDGVFARTGARVVSEPHARPRLRAGVDGGQARIERAIVDRYGQDDDGRQVQESRSLAAAPLASLDADVVHIDWRRLSMGLR
jgi:hypothetical protein